MVFAFAGDSTITKDLDIDYKNSLILAAVATQTAHIYKDKLQVGQVFSKKNILSAAPKSRVSG
ncbi:MAG: hypothetical protein DHS20C12_23960 [Pseudohongiella sp.]|nr:MAG: hypothetical protein DHS20C12_23960 [Pseudohongiella sp.]